MNNSPTKKKMLLSLWVFIILIAVLIFGHFYILNLAKESLEYKKSNAENSKIYYPEVLIDKKNQEAENVSTQLDQYFVNRDNVVGFIELLEKIADVEKVNMTIDNISVDETNLESEPVPYGILKALVTARGNWASVSEFLLKLENLPYGAQIKSSRLSRGGTSSEWVLSVVIEVITN